MNNVWNVIVDNSDFKIKTFLHDDDGHFCISINTDTISTGFHLMMKDTSKHNELITLLGSKLNNIVLSETDYTALAHAIGVHVENVIDELFDDYFYDYPEEELQMRTEEEIVEYLNEACDRVWLVRKQNMFCNIENGTEIIDAGILEQCKKAIVEACTKYDIDFSEPVSDWEYGYWSGILATLRWVLGEEKDRLDT